MWLSIVIVNWNTCDLLAKCLESVDTEIQLFPLGKVETLLVDNASTDGSAELVKKRFPWVQLLANSENVGFARANNQAMRVATGRHLLLLNSDTEIFPGALRTLADSLERHPRAGAVGPQVFNPDGTLQNSYGKLPTVLDELLGPYWADFLTKPWGKLGRLLWGYRISANMPNVVDRVSFACTLVRRTSLDQVGLLDESFEFYSEDYDLFKRLKDDGWVVMFCPQAQIMHHWGASSGQRSTWALRQLYRSKRRYFAKHDGPRMERVLRVGLALRFAAKVGIALASYPVCRSEAIEQARLYSCLIHDMQKNL